MPIRQSVIWCERGVALANTLLAILNQVPLSPTSLKARHTCTDSGQRDNCKGKDVVNLMGRVADRRNRRRSALDPLDGGPAYIEPFR